MCGGINETKSGNVIILFELIFCIADGGSFEIRLPGGNAEK
jgi:hypothetical protein